MGEGRKCNGDKQDRENSNRAPTPTFLSLAGQKWEKKQRADHDDRADEQSWRLHRRRQERKHCVKPQKEVISIPGITNTCRAKNRDRVAPAMMGPPSINFTMAGPRTGTRLAIDAPIPSPQYAS